MKRGKSEAVLMEVNTTLSKQNKNLNIMKHQFIGNIVNRTLQGCSQQNSDCGKLQNNNPVSLTNKLQEEKKKKR